MNKKTYSEIIQAHQQRLDRGLSFMSAISLRRQHNTKTFDPNAIPDLSDEELSAMEMCGVDMEAIPVDTLKEGGIDYAPTASTLISTLGYHLSRMGRTVSRASKEHAKRDSFGAYIGAT